MVYTNFDIEFSPILNEEKKSVKFNFHIKVGEEYINPNELTDIYGLMSLVSHHEKDYAYFWNCDCGVPDCKNIEPCSVKFSPILNKFIIILPVPCSTNDFQEGSYSYWKNNHKQITLKISKDEVARKLWDLSFLLEDALQKYTKEYTLGQWPTCLEDSEYSWPTNLAVDIRSSLIKEGYSFS